MKSTLKQLRNLDNKVVVITGASSGIGRACALQAAARGAIVVLCARHMDRLEAVRAQCQQISKQAAYAYVLDVGEPEAIDRFCVNMQTQVGQPDVLIHAAGFGHFDTVADTQPQLIQQMIQVNVLGTIYLSRRVAAMMMGRAGHIILLGSMAGKMATAKGAIYAASKFAVIGYANGLRLELQPLNIQVTTVNPGPVVTDFFKTADASGTYLQKVGNIALDADLLAQRIVNAVGYTVREINAPMIMTLATHLYNMAPRLGDYLAGHVFNQK